MLHGKLDIRVFPAEIGIFDIMELSASDIIAEYLDINAIRSILKQHKCPESNIVVYQIDRQDKEEYERKKAKDELERKEAELRYQRMLEDRR